MAISDDEYPQLETGLKRTALLLCGWCNIVLGFIGAVIPGVPSTVFFIIALWAFTRSSPKMRRWLYEHPRFGRMLQDWDQHGVIPTRVKRIAIATMVASLAVIAALAGGWMLPAVVAAIMTAVAAFIVTRPSQVVAETI